MSSSSWIERDAPAKLILFLEVVGRRPDGYHEIDSVLVAVDLRDTVRLAPAARTSLTVEGRDAPAGPDNLAWRAADALGARVRIHLVKRIPAGAGLGGGSSDAAAVLAALGGDRPPAELDRIAVSLGADVPYFLRGGLARCRGIGERVEPLAPGPPRTFLLALPALPLATAAVYGALGAGLTGKRQNATVFLRRFTNTDHGPPPYFNRLQGAAEGLEPRLREVREGAEAIWGRAFTMTGSGSAYFAETDDERPPRSYRTPGGVPVEVVRVRSR